MNHWRRFRVGLATGLLAVLLPAAVAAADAGRRVMLRDPGSRATVVLSPLTRLALSVQEAGAGERADFARTALEEMAAAYDEEIAQAGQSPLGNREQAGDRRRWIANTAAYTEHIRALARAIDTAANVEVNVDAGHMVRLLVDNQAMMVSGPRITEPERLERRIIDRYCLGRTCDALYAEPETQSPAGAETERGTWGFDRSRGSVYATADGLEFAFADIADLQGRRQRCLALAAELRTAGDALIELLLMGESVVWNRLRLDGDAASGEQRLHFNAAGDYVPVDVPRLAQVPQLLGDAIPWLRLRAEGKTSTIRLQAR
jgi:hypothetical protein